MDMTNGEVFDAPQKDKKLTPQTVLRKLFVVIGKKYSDKNGGYTRIYHLPPRRGDASEMALIQLV
jgi:large subunit ribosomal protein L17